LREANIPLERLDQEHATNPPDQWAMTALVQKDNKRAGRKTGEAQNLQTVRQEKKAVKLTPGMVYTYMTKRRGVSAADYILSPTQMQIFSEDASGCRRYGTDSEEPPTSAWH
jgi:hypothetical protein